MRIKLKNIKNMRDLGNYPTKSGGYTKNGTFYRSDLPKNMDDEEIEKILKLNISTVIDLRTEEEVNRKPNSLNIKNIDYYNVSLLGDRCPEFEKDIPIGYMNILSNNETMRKTFKIILNAKGSVLFNCTAGKDRTGVVAMLLLKLADVYDEDILVDYQISYTYLKEDIRKMHKDNPDLPAFLGESKMEYMEETLEMFNNKYVNIIDYFTNLGFSLDEILKIKSKLV